MTAFGPASTSTWPAAEQHDEDADDEEAATGFSKAGFQLLADLATTPNVRKEWFEEAGRRTIWQNQIRQPLAELVVCLGRELVVPLVNQSDVLAPDRQVVEPARTIGKPNSQSARASRSYYYPYLWAAFFPESQTRRQVAGQLFVLAHGNGIDVGVGLSSAPPAVQDRFIRNLADHAGRMGAHLRSSPMAARLVVRAFTLDQGPVGDSAPLAALTDLQVLASRVDEPTPSLVVHWPRSDAVSAIFDAEVDDAVRVLLPFLLLATVDEVAAALDALGLPAGEDEPETAEQPSEPEPQPSPAGYPIERLLTDTHLPRSWLAEVVNAAKFERDNRGGVGQVILYGLMGTGKTWLAEKIGWHLADGERGRFETVHFHPGSRDQRAPRRAAGGRRAGPRCGCLGRLVICQVPAFQAEYRSCVPEVLRLHYARASRDDPVSILPFPPVVYTDDDGEFWYASAHPAVERERWDRGPELEDGTTIWYRTVHLRRGSVLADVQDPTSTVRVITEPGHAEERLQLAILDGLRRMAVNPTPSTTPPAPSPDAGARLSTAEAASRLGLSRDALDAMRLRSAGWRLPGAPTRAGVGETRGHWDWREDLLLAWHHAYTERDGHERQAVVAAAATRRSPRRADGDAEGARARLLAKAPKR